MRKAELLWRNAAFIASVGVACTPEPSNVGASSSSASASVVAASATSSASVDTATASSTPVRSEPQRGKPRPSRREADRRPPKLEPDPSPGSIAMSKPLFTCGYANFAWGRVARGTVLDDKGRLWTYDLGTTWSGTPVPDGAEGLYLESGLRERFKKLVLQKTRVPLEQLATMQKKAESAREGRIEKRQVAHDAGGSGCDAYLWERPDAYREVELGTDGVYEVRNLSPEADEIWVWLEMDLGMR